MGIQLASFTVSVELALKLFPYVMLILLKLVGIPLRVVVDLYGQNREYRRIAEQCGVVFEATTLSLVTLTFTVTNVLYKAMSVGHGMIGAGLLLSLSAFVVSTVLCMWVLLQVFSGNDGATLLSIGWRKIFDVGIYGSLLTGALIEAS